MIALDAYKADTGQYPSTAEGLSALRIRPSSITGWQGPYLEKSVPRDFWGREYIYVFPGAHGSKPDILSYSADGKLGGTGTNADTESWTLDAAGRW
jgi:general secretion pathway protein G